MAQHDYVIDNLSAPASRADINAAFQAIVSQNSGAGAPSVTYANMIWYDTANDTLKIRNEANSAWISLGAVDQTLLTFSPNFTPATQAEAEAGTNNLKGMTPLRAAQAIAVLGGLADINIQVFTASGTYTPTTGYKRAIAFVTGGGEAGGGGTGGGQGNGGEAADTVIAFFSLVSLTPQTVTIGAGGTSSLGNGGNSSIGALAAATGGGNTGSNIGAVTITGGLAHFTFEGGMGGASFWGGGGGNSSSGQSSGSSGRAYGSGGAGGDSSSSTYTGGSGKSGVAVIMEFK